MQCCPVSLVFGRIPFAVTFADRVIADYDTAMGIKNFESCAIMCYYAARKMRPIGCPETSVGNYHYSMRNNPRRAQL
jgi:hypothetical protein